MQTRLPNDFLHTHAGQEAESILRACVHCGFCTAVCPTYTLLGDERDSPRGRIYLIKNLLEEASAGADTRRHLDRCLTCRACETACPSGVQYARLADIGRTELEKRAPRPWPQRWLRAGLRKALAEPKIFATLLKIARWLRPVLPDILKRRIPAPPGSAAWPAARHPRRILVPAGCVQPALAPDIDAALARLLDRHGISAVPIHSGCCGAIDQHLAAPEAALVRIRANIDAWWPLIEARAEAIAITSSACGSMAREYGHLLRHDPAYADKAARVSTLCRDPVELLQDLPWGNIGLGRRIAFHAPCSLQNGLKLHEAVENLLRRAGFDLVPVAEPNMCCGAAGTYSILQPELSQQLLERKLEHLQAGKPELVLTANIGCLSHLQSVGGVPVMHWVSLLAADIEPVHKYNPSCSPKACQSH